MKKILVPCDFSLSSVEAFKFAVSLAKATKGHITVLKVIDLPLVYDTNFGGPAFAFDPAMLQEIVDGYKQQYKKLVAKYARDFAPVTFANAQGPVTAMIRMQIEARKPDLVVMGTTGATGMKELFVGSNTEKIVRFSKVPVFVVRKAVAVSSIKNILFPASLHLNQGDFVKKLKGLQELFKAKLHVLHINTPSHFVSDEELEEFAQHYKLSNYTLNLRSDRHEQDGIMAFAKRRNIDMIAMTTHGRKGLAHLVSGSIAEDVVNHVDCPIWTYVLKKAN